MSKKPLLDMPLIGLGTWELRGKECIDVVALALKLGYRHIDTAHVYDNHKDIAKAIKGFERSDLYITSKLAMVQVDLEHVAESVERACDLALKELKIEYLDQYLMHWPDRTKPLSKIFKAMQALVKKGKIRHAGVSNFTIHHLEDLHKDGCHPAVNQCEFHPYLNQKELWKYCQKHKIQLTAYRPLGKKKLLEEPIFTHLGRPHNKSAAQVILRWLVQKGIPVIPKSSTKKHLHDNLQIFDFALSKEEMKVLDSLNKNKRFCGEGNADLEY